MKTDLYSHHLFSFALFHKDPPSDSYKEESWANAKSQGHIVCWKSLTRKCEMTSATINLNHKIAFTPSFSPDTEFETFLKQQVSI